MQIIFEFRRWDNGAIYNATLEKLFGAKYFLTQNKKLCKGSCIPIYRNPELNAQQHI